MRGFHGEAGRRQEGNAVHRGASRGGRPNLSTLAV
jgi:hypothetical protein